MKYCIVLDMFFTNSIVIRAGLESEFYAKKTAELLDLETPYESYRVMSESDAIHCINLFMEQDVADQFKSVIVPKHLIK